MYFWQIDRNSLRILRFFFDVGYEQLQVLYFGCMFAAVEARKERISIMVVFLSSPMMVRSGKSYVSDQAKNSRD